MADTAQQYAPCDNTADHLQQDALDALRSVLGADAFAAIVQNYLDDVEASVSCICACAQVSAEDRDTVQKLIEAAHDLKGCSGQIGAHRLNAMALELETACKRTMAGDRAQFHRVAEIQSRLSGEFATVRALIEAATASAGGH